MAIIVNADDYGLSSSVNAAVIESFRRGWISSATLMANMPGFNEAVELTHRHKLIGRIGVHLNLTEGRPLTDSIRRQPRLCTQDGRLRAKSRDLFIVSREERSAIHAELRAQVTACRNAELPPSHLDSHHHVHSSWAVGGVVMAIAREFGIPFIRLAHNAGGLISRKHRLYSAVFNQRLRFRGLAGVRYFCSLTSATPALLAARGGIEVMVHPVMQADGRVTDYGDRDELGPLVARFLEGRELMSYGELRTSMNP